MKNYWQKFSKTFKSSLGIISVIILIVVWSVISYYGISYSKELIAGISDSSDTSSSTASTYDNPDCNTYGVKIRGDLVTYNSNDSFNDQGNLILDQTSAGDVVSIVKDAQDKDNIKAIVVEINSSGGSGEAGQEIMQAFKDSKKPVVAFIRDRGLSASYLAATGAQTIFASQFSDVGSIGVTMSYLQKSIKDRTDGLTYIDLSSGKYKDSGNPSRPLTDDEKSLFMRDVNIGYNLFMNFVSQNRNLSIEKVKALADGSSVMGETALKDGLIDKIGLLPDVEKYMSEKIGTDTNICWQN